MNLKNVRVDDLANGYVEKKDKYNCIFCDFQTSKMEIYSHNKSYLTALGRMVAHLQDEHGSSFHQLLSLPKKVNGLTDNQKKILENMLNNISDKETAKELSVAESTVRHQRFTLKEKAQQAKVFLAIYESLGGKKEDDFLEVHQNAKQVDERYAATKEDEKKVIKDFFVSENPLVLKLIPRKDKYKIIILRKISELFNMGEKFSEQEVNNVLKSIYSDYVTLRRYLIEYGFLTRDAEGRTYTRQS